MTQSYIEAARERVVIFDGAAGTNLQLAGLTAGDFGGEQYEGCNEILNVTRPDVVTALHTSFLEVGVDVVETNTFGCFAIPLTEYGLEDRTRELATAGAALARDAADRFATPDRPRWVAGSIGPGTKMPTLGHITYADLRDAYQVMAEGLLDGGIDLFLVETMYDLLGLKAAIAACRRAMTAAGREVPIQAQVTIETNGRMLAGTDIEAALAAVEALRPDVIGLNCATGPAEMIEPLRYLAAHSRTPISAIPNAGMPSIVEGEMHYGLTPDALADHHERLITELGVSVIGGCCGTTPEHLAAVIDRCAGLEPAARAPRHQPGASSIYGFVPFEQDTSFLIIGERTNANGSKAFRDALLAEDLDACVDIGRGQVGEAAHLIDLCVDYVGRDGATDMSELAFRFATQVEAPMVLDSTEPEVMAAGLERLGGRSILNSVNLEDGDGPGSRLDRTLSLARDHGAGVICLLVDEEGQARDVEWKLRIAHRIHDLAVERYGLNPSDLLIDPLTFPLTTGDEDLRADAMATIEAVRRIKEELPGVRTVLGISNVSFGLKWGARKILNSVFLHECLAAGLDAAIVHAGRVIPLNRIPEQQHDICLDLIYDRRGDGDPLTRLLAEFEDAAAAAPDPEARRALPVEERLRHRIIDGDRTGLTDDLDEALSEGWQPLDLINDVLLSGMKTVGELFASGEMQLPFVMQSAETMKAAVRHLEPFMEHAAATDRASIVVATVAGDVHDIGKNLVDIILTNNGYRVHNLGIKVGITELLEAVVEHDADAIGMSGLLVKSTLVMRDNLEEIERRGLRTPVILGGAALTRGYVERDLREVYEGPLFYGKDAFAGLRMMSRIAESKKIGTLEPDFGRVDEERILPKRRAAAAADGPIPDRSPDVAPDNPLFAPPFHGSRVVTGVPIDDLAGYINRTALFRNQWQFRPEADEDDSAFKRRLAPLLEERLQLAAEEGLLEPKVVYGYFAAGADGDDLVVFDGPGRSTELARFSFPRQHEPPYLCIADFFRPADGPETDTAAFHIVTMGALVSERATELFATDRYHDYLLTHGLGVELTEALAEFWHRHIRHEWGFGEQDDPTVTGLFRQRFRGSRYSWGYPACPDLEDNATVAALLGADRIGITVGSETGYQYQPEQTTSAIISHHPQAKYFVARESR